MYKTWEQSRKYCKGLEKSLEIKKGKLFAQGGDVSKWDLTDDGRNKYTAVQLAGSKALAFREMLVKVELSIIYIYRKQRN